MVIKRLYIVGSLRNPRVIEVGNAVRALGIEAFDDWYAAGPEADDYWKAYEKGRGNDYKAALSGWAARHVFSFDSYHLDRSDGGILVLPAGRSGHLELGYLAGQAKPTYILLEDDPDRWDVMYQFASRGVFWTLGDLLADLEGKLND